MGREGEPKRGMNRDEWNYYCGLCKTGDSEAVREYMKKFEKQKQVCKNCRHNISIWSEEGLGICYCDIDEHEISYFEDVEFPCGDWEEDE